MEIGNLIGNSKDFSNWIEKNNEKPIEIQLSFQWIPVKILLRNKLKFKWNSNEYPFEIKLEFNSNMKFQWYINENFKENGAWN